MHSVADQRPVTPLAAKWRVELVLSATTSGKIHSVTVGWLANNSNCDQVATCGLAAGKNHCVTTCSISGSPLQSLGHLSNLCDNLSNLCENLSNL